MQVAGFERRAPHSVAALVVGYRHRPAFGEGGGDQQKLQLSQRADGLRASPQRVGRETAGRHRVDRALVRQHRAGPVGRDVGGHDHRRRRRLRQAVHVGRPVQQLGGHASAAGSGREMPAPHRANAAPCRAWRAGNQAAARRTGRPTAAAGGPWPATPHAARDRSIPHRLALARLPMSIGALLLKRALRIQSARR